MDHSVELAELPLHHVSWMHATSTFLSDNASATSPALPVNMSAFDVPTGYPQS